MNKNNDNIAVGAETAPGRRTAPEHARMCDDGDLSNPGVSAFGSAIDSLRPKCDALLAMEPVQLDALPRDMPKRGVYLFSEGERHVYAGRSNSLRNRLHRHVHNSHSTATLAFLMARQETGNVQATYKPQGSRTDLLRGSDFKAAFDAARQQIRQMSIRYVEEADPVRQALLEIYVALASGAEHNSFDNH